MAAPDGFRLAEELRETFLSYLTSALPIGNHQSQHELGKCFYQQWSSELFAGPLVEVLPLYPKVGSLDDYFGDARDKQSDDFKFAARMNVSLDWADVDHRFPQFRKIRDAIWPPSSDDAEEEGVRTSANRFWERPMYEHQWESFQKVAQQRRNLIVATSTGSGKTECYLIPLLHHLLTESDEQRRVPGVRALLLYPMNALVEDQMHRLRQLLFWINLQNHASGNARRPITFGRYNGATPVASNDRNPERQVSPEALHGLGELIYRSEMQAQPPDILVTNFTMLEYILLRDDDQQLFAHPECFRFLVLDEVHTYTGTQGMEVALLLRRLRAFLGRKSGQRASFQVIGTSATLPSALGAPQPFIAWCFAGYVNALGPLGLPNSFAADVWRVDNADLPATASGGNLLGNAGSWANLRPMFYVGKGQVILFRLRVSHAVTMEVASQAIVLYDL